MENQLCCRIGRGRAHYHTTEWWLTLWVCDVPKSGLALYGNRVFRTDLNSLKTKYKNATKLNLEFKCDPKNSKKKKNS
jgi:hypothetical protein